MFNGYYVEKACLEDLDGFIDLIEKFYKTAGVNKYIEFNRGTSTQVFKDALNSESLCIFVLKHILTGNKVIGTIMGAFFPFYANPLFLVGQEVAYFVEEEHRGFGKLLLKSLEEESRKRGVKLLTMISMESINPKATDLFYKRNGYKLVEHSYVKEM